MSSKGKVIILDHQFEYLGTERKVRVYLPPNIEQGESYPVLYMHDGQNLFYPEWSKHNKSWMIHDSLNELFARSESTPIVVGVDCPTNNPDDRQTLRLDEYSPWIKTDLFQSPRWSDIPSAGGNGEHYADFIVKTLKPFIDENFPTLPQKENTYVGGSSMGGLISLYISLKYPELFNGVMALSSAFWFSPTEMKDFISKARDISQNIYLDIGTCETSDESVSEFPTIYLDSNREVYDHLLNCGHTEVSFKVIDGAEHDELAWAKRFINAWKWISKN